MSKIARLVLAAGLLAGPGPWCIIGGLGESAKAAPVANGALQKGGDATFLASGDVDSLDPAITHSSFCYMVLDATNRPLYSFKPGARAHPVPDLAAGPPDISMGGKRITVHIKHGIRYSPPLQNLVVTTADIKYAFERAFSTHVPSAYAEAYFGSIVGSPSTPTAAIPDISGIVTKGKYTIIFNLSVPDASEVAAALVLPITVPVPGGYAKQYDQDTPSTYGAHVVSTGPYMVESYTPGTDIELVRNPSWVAQTDYRPAYLDSITIKEGNTNLATASAVALAGSGEICCDTGQLPPQALAQALGHKSQVALTPAHSTRWIALDTKVAPFNNLNVREAVIAASDRRDLWLADGGQDAGYLANGYVPPGTADFAAAGGLKQNGGLEFMKSPSGNLELAKKYMLEAKRQGAANISSAGMYTGPELVAVTDNLLPDTSSALAAQSQFAKLGFALKLVDVPQSGLYSDYCGVPSALQKDNVAVCMNVVSFGGYDDPQSLLAPTFDGNYILADGNLNFSELNDPAINAAMSQAVGLPAGQTRLNAWAKVSQMIAADAPGIPYLWGKNVTVASANVKLVINGYYGAADLSFTSLS